MSGRRYVPQTGKTTGGSCGSGFVPENRPPKEPRPKKPVDPNAPPISESETSGREIVRKATVAIAQAIVDGCPVSPVAYDDVRALTMLCMYQAFATNYGMQSHDVPLPIATSSIHRIIEALRPIRSHPDLTPENFGSAHEYLSWLKIEGGKVVRTGQKTAVHFTPRSLTEPIAAKTLAPHYATYSSERTLALRVCDPSVGAGAFLLEVIRQLAPRALDAGLAPDLLTAKRLVAIHCCCGVDLCPWAVWACKMALTLECRADAMPSTWLDDNIKCGDALVGLTEEQLRAFHWKKPKQPELDALSIAPHVDRALELGRQARVARMADLDAHARRIS